MVGKRIKELRKYKNLSLKQLADKIPLSVSFLSDIENGRSNPSIKRLEEIALALETTTAYLLEGDTINKSQFSSKLTADSFFTEMLDYLNDFDLWSLADKEELLAYLKAKAIVRADKN